MLSNEHYLINALVVGKKGTRYDIHLFIDVEYEQKTKE
jgi:hypothetical protein